MELKSFTATHVEERTVRVGGTYFPDKPEYGKVQRIERTPEGGINVFSTKGQSTHYYPTWIVPDSIVEK